MKRALHGLGLGLCLAVGSCGPAGIAIGVDEAARGRDRTQVFVIVIVNNDSEPIVVRVSGAAVDVPDVAVLPGGSADLRLPPSGTYRVTATAGPSPSGRAPVSWDFDVPAQGAGTVTALAAESVVLASRFSTMGGGRPADLVDIERLPPEGATFAQVRQTQLDVAPDLVRLHPAGAWFYTVRDLGGGRGDIRTWRIHAVTAALEPVEPESGRGAPNPMEFSYADDFTVVLDPSGRFVWVLDRDRTHFRTLVRAHRVLPGGALEPSGTSMRGLIGSMTLSPDGANAYVAEDLGSGHRIRALRVDPVTGRFDFQINETSTPCRTDDTEAPLLAVHRSGRFLYAATQTAGPLVRLGSYEIFGDGSIFALGQCLTFQRIENLAFDPGRDFLYVTGTDSGGAVGVLRFRVDPGTGRLTAAGTQAFPGPLSRISAGTNPELPSSHARKHVVYLSVGDSIVPHASDESGVLTPIADGQANVPTLPFGGEASARFVTAYLRGKARLTPVGR